MGGFLWYSLPQFFPHLSESPIFKKEKIWNVGIVIIKLYGAETMIMKIMGWKEKVLLVIFLAVNVRLHMNVICL
jgi:hypothetical protein